MVPEVTIERWSPGRRVGLVPLARGGVYAYLVQSAPRGTVGPGSATCNYLRRNFLTGEHADERLAALLDHADRTRATIHHGDLCDLPVLCFGRGRVVLLGDAAQSFTLMWVFSSTTTPMILPSKSSVTSPVCWTGISAECPGEAIAVPLR